MGEIIVFDPGSENTKNDDVTITILNMDDNLPKKDSITGRIFEEALRRNDASIVFKLQYGPTSFLVTGDIIGRKKGRMIVITIVKKKNW